MNDLVYRLHCALTAFVMDGTEGHAIIEDLVKAVDDANGDSVRIRSAALEAKTRMRALLAGSVHLEAVTNAVGNIIEDN